MKARKLILASAIIVAALSSCQKEDPVIINECNCPGIDAVLVTVNQNQWQYSQVDNNNYFYATVDMPEITQEVFKTGLVKMYRVWDWGSNNAVQMEMPFSRHIEEALDDEGNDWAFYTESLDYEFSVGKMTICYTLSDFFYELDESFWPDTMQFRCVVME